MSITFPLEADPNADIEKYLLVDADVHSQMLPSALKARLPQRFRRRYEEFGLRRIKSAILLYPRLLSGGARLDSFPENGVPGSDLALMQEQLLDRYAIDVAVLNPQQGLEFGGQEPEYAAALTTALNDWTGTEWLERDSRLRGGITVPFEDPQLAVREIERLGPDRRFVHVYFGSRMESPIGHRRYWPVYQAMAEYDLALTVHVGELGPGAVTGAGWPSYYIEDHVSFSQSVAATAATLICRGVFKEFPTLKVLLEEGGMAWAPYYMRTLDDMLPLLEAENGPLDRKPSEYFRAHFYFTTQPIEEPPIRSQLAALMGEMGIEGNIVFSSDYPHWDFDAPGSLLETYFPPSWRERIYGRNASNLYGLSV